MDAYDSCAQHILRSNSCHFGGSLRPNGWKPGKDDAKYISNNRPLLVSSSHHNGIYEHMALHCVCIPFTSLRIYTRKVKFPTPPEWLISYDCAGLKLKQPCFKFKTLFIIICFLFYNLISDNILSVYGLWFKWYFVVFVASCRLQYSWDGNLFSDHCLTKHFSSL